MDNSQVNWLDLPSRVLVSISDKLVHAKHYICFGAVCHSWYSIYSENRARCLLRRRLPMLVIARPYTVFFAQTQFNFYDLSQRKFYHIPIRVPHHANCRGSTEGWIVYEDKSQLHLVNPFLSSANKKIHIHLPVLTAFEDEESYISTADNCTYFFKAVLSANPALYPNYKVMAMNASREKLALYKSGDNDWTWNCSILTDLVDNERVGYIEDIIYCVNGDCFYVVDCYGAVWAYDVSSPSPRVSKVASPIAKELYPPSRKYIVESSDNLLLVKRSYVQQFEPGDNKCAFKTVNIKVSKLDRVASEWIEMNTLCGQTLFVGNNTSQSVLASDHPGCKADCVYYTNDGCDAGQFPKDMGVYNMADGSIEQVYPTESIMYPTCVWIEPTFAGEGGIESLLSEGLLS